MSNDAVEKQVELLKEIGVIIQSLERDIELKAQSIGYSDDVEDQIQSSIYVDTNRHLKYFSDIILFLAEKLLSEKEEYFRFYIIHLRTLLDIYSKILYSLNQDKKRQKALWVANTLFTLAYTTRDSTHNRASIVETYQEGLTMYASFITAENIKIPTDIAEFSKNRLKKMGLAYPSPSEILGKEYARDCSERTLELWPSSLKTISGLYTHFSNYVHGNSLTNAGYGNEDLWIISNCEILTSLLAEVVDMKLLGDNKAEELKKWRGEIKKTASPFVDYWRNRNQSRT